MAFRSNRVAPQREIRLIQPRDGELDHSGMPSARA
jgi:hypothetical protein